MDHNLPPNVKAALADPVLRRRFQKKAGRQAQTAKQTADTAPILQVNDGYFVNPRQPPPPYEGRSEQLSLDFTTEAAAHKKGSPGG